MRIFESREKISVLPDNDELLSDDPGAICIYAALVYSGSEGCNG